MKTTPIKTTRDPKNIAFRWIFFVKLSLKHIVQNFRLFQESFTEALFNLKKNNNNLLKLRKNSEVPSLNFIQTILNNAQYVFVIIDTCSTISS